VTARGRFPARLPHPRDVTHRPGARRARAGRRCAWPALALLLGAAPSGAQPPPAELQFLGFRPGAPLAEVERQAAAHGAASLTCDTARRDARVRECRGTLYADTPTPLALRAVLIEGTAAIILVTGAVPEAERLRWERAMEAAYGTVPARVAREPRRAGGVGEPGGRTDPRRLGPLAPVRCPGGLPPAPMVRNVNPFATLPCPAPLRPGAARSPACGGPGASPPSRSGT
jgi:hypothetical protein